jgi:hypothetical protein
VKRIEPPDRLKQLWDLLDQEIAAYQILLEDLRQEWGCLKQDDTLTLPTLLQAKIIHIQRIEEIRGSVQTVLSELVGNSTLPSQQAILDLVSRLPISQGNQFRIYQRKMSGLKEQIFRTNERNNHFIQEILNYLKGLFSLWTSPVLEDPVYLKDGRKISPPSLRSWMSKEV